MLDLLTCPRVLCSGDKAAPFCSWGLSALKKRKIQSARECTECLSEINVHRQASSIQCLGSMVEPTDNPVS